MSGGRMGETGGEGGGGRDKRERQVLEGSGRGWKRQEGRG